MAKQKVNEDGCIVTVRVPISIRKRGGRRKKSLAAPAHRHIDNAMVKASARRFDGVKCWMCFAVT